MNCKKFPPLIFLFQIRSCTMESVAWCKAMFDGNADVRDFSTIRVSKDHVIRVSLGLNVLNDRFISYSMSLSPFYAPVSICIFSIQLSTNF